MLECCVHEDGRREGRVLAGDGGARKGHEDNGVKAGMNWACVRRRGETGSGAHLGKEEECRLKARSSG